MIDWRLLLRQGLGVGLTALVVGCANNKPTQVMVAPYTPPSVTDITQTSYVAADALIAQIRATIPPDTMVIVATLVNINNLEDSSPLGRLVAEQIAGRFVHGGYQVIEVKLRNQIYMKRSEGELILTREVRDIAKKHNARIIVSGTYADSKDRIFVNLKVIRLENNIVAAAYDYHLNKDDQVRSLLKSAQ